jgi:hypothetical protein
LRDRAREKEIIACQLAEPWQVLIGKGKDSGILQIIAENGVSNPGIERNKAMFIVAARTGWPEDLAWREKAEKLLQKLEWSGGDDEYCQYKFCPCCRRWNQSGHAVDCELKSLIAEVQRG